MKLQKLFTSAAVIGALALPFNAQANPLDQVRGLKADLSKQVQAPEIIKAIKEQNAAHASLTQADIDKLDSLWRTEVQADSKPTIEAKLKGPAAKKLVEIQNGTQGLVVESFVTDNKGLNVAQSSVTSDYWQGDEAKYQDTYLKGAGADHVSEVDFDESAQLFVSQLSFTIVDPETNEPIGAATFSVNVEELDQ